MKQDGYAIGGGTRYGFIRLTVWRLSTQGPQTVALSNVKADFVYRGAVVSRIWHARPSLSTEQGKTPWGSNTPLTHTYHLCLSPCAFKLHRASVF